VPNPVKKLPIDLASLARSYTEQAILTLGGVMKDGIEESNRIRAADILLDRGWGRPKQDNSHEVKGEIKVILRQMLEDDDE
jgi:hypothetical protein